MWALNEVVGTTAFFQRTDAETFDPLGDGWWLQGYNEQAYQEMLRPPRTPRFPWLRAHAPEWAKVAWRRMNVQRR